MRNKKEVFSDKPQIFRTMLSVIAALLVYEAGKAAGLMLAGLLFGSGGSTGGMDAGTVNNGLTGGMANLLMTLTGGLACLAVWRSSLNFRLGKRPGWKWIPPFILLAAALSLGLNIVIAYLGLAQHSQTFQQVAKEQAAVPLWLGICLYGFAAPFPRTGFPGNYLWKIQRGIRRACCHGIFRRGFRHLSREPGAGIYASLLGIMLAWVMERSGTLLAPVIFHGIGNLAVFFLIDVAGLGSILAQPLVCVGLLAISGVCFWYLVTGKAFH